MRPKVQGISPQNRVKDTVLRYLHFRILNFPFPLEVWLPSILYFSRNIGNFIITTNKLIFFSGVAQPPIIELDDGTICRKPLE